MNEDRRLGYSPFWLGCVALTIGLAICGCSEEDPQGSDEDSGGDTGSQEIFDTETVLKRDPLCETEQSIEITPIKKDLLIAMERSPLVLMDNGFASVMLDSLIEFAYQLEDWMDMALLAYPDPTCVNLLEQNLPAVCSTSESVVIPFGEEDQALEFDHTLGGWYGLGFCGVPPLTNAVKAAQSYLASVPDRSGADVLLITSGESYCNSTLDGTTCQCDPLYAPCDTTPEFCHDLAGTLPEVDQLYQDGHKTYVLLLNNLTDRTPAADSWAAAGGTGQSYYSQTADEQVHWQMDAIRRELQHCRFKVDWDAAGIDSVSQDEKEQINFFYDGLVLGYDELCDPGIGWHWDGDDTIVLCQKTCDILKQANAITSLTFEASHGCPSQLSDSIE